MKVTHVDPTRDLIIVTAHVWGPRGDKAVSLAVDTAATQTHLILMIATRSCSARHGDQS